MPGPDEENSQHSWCSKETSTEASSGSEYCGVVRYNMMPGTARHSTATSDRTSRLSAVPSGPSLPPAAAHISYSSARILVSVISTFAIIPVFSSLKPSGSSYIILGFFSLSFQTSPLPIHTDSASCSSPEEEAATSEARRRCGWSGWQWRRHLYRYRLTGWEGGEPV